VTRQGVRSIASSFVVVFQLRIVTLLETGFWTSCGNLLWLARLLRRRKYNARV